MNGIYYRLSFVFFCFVCLNTIYNDYNGREEVRELTLNYFSFIIQFYFRFGYFTKHSGALNISTFKMYITSTEINRKATN